MKSNVRGSGFRHTLPAVIRFSGLWFVLLMLPTPLITVSMMMRGIIPPELHRVVWFFLFTRMPIVALAGIALAVLTTTRVAGPIVHLKRVFEDVKGGDMDRRLTFRKSDEHLRGLETAFNEMMVALRPTAATLVPLTPEIQGRPSAAALAAWVSKEVEGSRHASLAARRVLWQHVGK